MSWFISFYYTPIYIYFLIKCFTSCTFYNLWRQTHYGKLLSPLIRIHKKAIHESSVTYDTTPACTPRHIDNKIMNNNCWLKIYLQLIYVQYKNLPTHLYYCNSLKQIFKCMFVQYYIWGIMMIYYLFGFCGHSGKTTINLQSY